MKKRVCKNCKHWLQEAEFRHHTCKSPKVHYGYGAVREFEDDDIQVEFDEGWGMICGPEFGCVHYEERGQ